MRNKKNIRWNTLRITAAGFLGVILLGAMLLYLPVSNTQPIAFIDALFTAVTSVCVTGLVTVVPASQFTLFGKIILLVLIQIGGLGVIACATLFLFLLNRRITIQERVVLKEAYGADRLGGIVKMVKKVILGTFAVEGAGAVMYAFQFIPEYGVIRGIGYSVFHAVSAFCNAGIDILGNNSLADYVTNPIINVTTILLIILSGLGFTVWFDVIGTSRRVIRGEVPTRWWFTRLRLQSKLALLMTGTLLLAGTLFVLFVENGNPETIGGLNPGQKLMASLFQSVTTRTAGFFTVPQGALHAESKLFCAILMFIGGSPGGTAGGVKTTTFVMLFLACLTFVRGGNDTECMGKKITVANFRTGFCVIMVAFAVFITGTIAILIIEPDSILLENVIYETASAVGTVGLTADLTPQLSRISQSVLMVMMYIGRLGPLTLALMFAGKTHPRDRIRSLPEEQIMVG
ncbi:MAG: potassium transporter KtrB [Ruminococcus sp.]|uniref:Potassium transporter KtrB n=1 Tax=Schaedlerella arabinosiphila TaxID=2044587 RepID=A0A426DQ32_9FIRM|nr:potassium transporter TrkG [Schaedlerella arabinosiphila]MCI8723425.1 potassium transporter KtrB [Ruminococcus sp.]MCI9212220.1 potassium transporter KtrB [Ruminococcus sp.]RRK34895.1 potassium transporter KtrB [Schaedlerella arabinosiphila]